MKMIWAVVAVVYATGAWAEDAYIQTDGTQYFRTEYYAKPTTKIVCDFAYTSLAGQQRIFGADSSDDAAKLSCSSYINGGGSYAWAFKDGAGDWTSLGVTATTDRRTLILDGALNQATLMTGETVTKTKAFTGNRTATAAWPLVICAGNRGADYSNVIHPAKAKVYGFAIFEDGALVHYYKPYKSADGTKVGLKDLVTGEIHEPFAVETSATALTYGGDIGENPTYDSCGIRMGTNGPVFQTKVVPGSNGTVSITKNGEVVEGTEVWAGASDTVVVTATATEGRRFLQWTGDRGSFAEGSYLGNASVTIHPRGSTSLTALWTTETTKTRTWTPTIKSADGFLFKTDDNWRDENGEMGAPRIGDTAIFGTAASTNGARSIGNSSHPLYEIRYENVKTVSMNQGSFVFLAGGRGLQYLRNADSGSNWSGLTFIGDGIVPVNIASNVNFVMQKACAVGSLAGYRKTPIVVKQGLGTVINCNQSGGYDYTVPTTLIQEGRWDITHTKTLTDCTIGFDGPAAKCLTFCYGTYETDLPFVNGGIFEINGASNHVIGANNKLRNVIFSGTPKFNPMVFSGRFVEGAGLTWSPSDADYVFVCSNAVSDTAGKVLVTKGMVKLVAGASFTALSELNVAAGAVFAVEPGSGADLRAESLVLDSAAAQIHLPAGVTLATTRATVSGAALSPGTYAAEAGDGVRKAPWIVGAGTVTVVEGPANTATWCGGDETSTLLSQGKNWEGESAPDLVTGDLLANFATGGGEARLAGSAAFNGIALNNAFGGTAFNFTAEPGGSATLNGNGVNVVAAAAATTWTLGWPIALGTDQTWVIGANNTLTLAGGLSGASSLSIENAGTLHLAAPSTQTGALELNGGTVRVSADNAFGPAGRTVDYHHLATKYVFAGNVTLDAPMYSSDLRESWDAVMTLEDNAHVTFNGNFGWKADGGITLGAGSVLVFKDGVRFSTEGMKGRVVPRGSGTMIVSNKTISACRSWVGQANNPVTLELCCSGNMLNDQSYWTEFRAGRLVTRVANAIKSSQTYLYFDDATFDLSGGDQTIDLIATTAKSKIVSDAPATLTVNSTHATGGTQSGSHGDDTRVNKAVFSGYVSFVKKGANHPHTFGAVSSTTGAVEVAAGTLTFNADAAWPHATEVRVTGGTLALQNAAPFGEKTVWRVTTGSESAVKLDYTGVIRSEKVFVDGKRLAGGVYGAVGSGAEKEVDWISGAGTLRVVPDGTVIVFR